MSNYKPGTLNDDDVVKRKIEGISRVAREANRPTGSNAYGTTGKLQDLDGSGMEQYALPVHAVVRMTVKQPPSDFGYIGTWHYLGAEFAALSSFENPLYLYERVL